jgi:hypothetical protein
VYEFLVAQGGAMIDRLVLMTGGAFTPHMREFLETTDVRCLEKPFSFEDFDELVRDFADAKRR